MECPVCIGIGKDAVKDCEKSYKFFTCNAKEAVCMSMKNGGLLIRDCVNMNYYYKKLVSVCTQKLDDCEIVHGQIYGRLMGCTANDFLSI